MESTHTLTCTCLGVGQVWMRLSSAYNDELEEQYRFFLTQPSGCDDAISWDLERTFPAHPYFKEKLGQGQMQLRNISHVRRAVGGEGKVLVKARGGRQFLSLHTHTAR